MSRCSNKLGSKGLLGKDPEETLKNAERYFSSEQNVYEYARVLVCLKELKVLDTSHLKKFSKLLEEKRFSFCSDYISGTTGISKDSLKKPKEAREKFVEWYGSGRNQSELAKVKQCLVDLHVFETPFEAQKFINAFDSDVCSDFLKETGIIQDKGKNSKEEVFQRLFLWYTKYGKDSVNLNRILKCLGVLEIFVDRKQLTKKLEAMKVASETILSCANFLNTLGIWPTSARDRPYLETWEVEGAEALLASYLSRTTDDATAEKVKECAITTGIIGKDYQISLGDKDIVLSENVVSSISESKKSEKAKCREYLADAGAFPPSLAFITPKDVKFYGNAMHYAYEEANLLSKLRILECAEPLGFYTQAQTKKKKEELLECLGKLRKEGVSSVSSFDEFDLSSLREVEMRAREGVWNEETSRCVQKILGGAEGPRVKPKLQVVPYTGPQGSPLFRKELEKLDKNISRSDIMAYFLLVLKLAGAAPSSTLLPEATFLYGDEIAYRVEELLEEERDIVQKQELLISAGALGILNEPKYERLAKNLEKDAKKILSENKVTKTTLFEAFEIFINEGRYDAAFKLLRIAGMADVLEEKEVPFYLEILAPYKENCIRDLINSGFLYRTEPEKIDIYLPVVAHRFIIWSESRFDDSSLDGKKFMDVASCISFLNSKDRSNFVFSIPSYKDIKNIKKDTVDNIKKNLKYLREMDIIGEEIPQNDIERMAESINENFVSRYETLLPEKKVELLAAVAATGIAESESLQVLRRNAVVQEEQKKIEGTPFMITSAPPKSGLPKGITCTIGNDGKYYWFINGKRTKSKKEWSRDECKKSSRPFMTTRKRPRKLPKGTMCIEGKDGKFYWLKKGKLVASGKNIRCGGAL